MPTIRDGIDRWTQQHVAFWSQPPSGGTSFFQKASLEQKERGERELELLLRKIPHSREEYNALDEGRRAALRLRLRTAVARSLSVQGDRSAESFFRECEHVADAFVHRAEEFDSELMEREIYQALRNQWVFNSIQRFLGHAVSLTSSAFAYSLLYPYTDNRLDGAAGRGENAGPFLMWLARRLEGVSSAWTDGFEEKIDRLLGMIEAEYPRASFPEVYAGLLAIHTGQQNSLELRGKFGPAEETRLLALSMVKGGASVLADGLLAAGSLPEHLAEAVFAYGVLLQLLDDLQDLDEDRERDHSTVFTRALERGTLDDSTGRLMDHLGRCLAMMSGRSVDSTLPVLVGRSCSILVLEAVARYRAHYSKPFLTLMEEFSPLRFEYLGKVKERVSRLV